MMNKNKNFIRNIINIFTRLVHPMPMNERKEVIADITTSASPGVDFYLLVVLSSSIATLGLVTNSAAVIIGAMLLAPLMSPIISLGLSSITGDYKLIKISASTFLRGAVLAILLSFLTTLVNRFLPFIALQDIPAEIMARIRPTPIDLMIALAGGLAAAYALTRPNLSAALPGVAIATALMPPLCTIGIGLAINRWDVTGGASLLFITNAVTIAFASALVFFIRGFSVEARREGQRLPKSLILSAILVAILLIPLSVYSVKFFREASENRLINTVVSREVSSLDGTQLVDVHINHVGDMLDMVITIRTSNALTYEEVLGLQKAIVAGLDRPVSLKIEQVIAEILDPLVPPTPTFTPRSTFTPTPGSSSTPTALPTATATVTPSATPTPSNAQLQIIGLPKLELYQTPGGPVIGKLRSGQWITILYGRKQFNGLVWIEIMDEEGRIGWIPEIYIFYITPTPEQ
jgi:uncharacterized hydrophobic protein (TIGR00271 family)